MLRRFLLLLAAFFVSIVTLTHASPGPKGHHRRHQSESNHDSGLSPTAEDVNASITTPTATASINHNATDPTDESNTPTGSKVVDQEINSLRDALSVTTDIQDIRAFGTRVQSFARLLEAVQKDESLDRTQALEVFDEYFPWWRPQASTFHPWYHYPVTPDPTERKRPEDPPNPEATGYVMCVGNNNMDLAAHSIQMLYFVLASQIRFEVAYAGDEDFSPENREKFQKYIPEVKFMDLMEYFDEDVAGLANATWAMKPFAALNSRYKKVIVVDADAIFLGLPDLYFDLHTNLKETGLLYFHDRAIKEGKDFTWAEELMKGKEPSMELEQSIFWEEKIPHQQESGVVFIDKSKPSAFMSLMFTTYMNTWEVTSRVLDSKFHGDKETWWLASELSSAPYTFSPNYAGMIGYEETVESLDKGAAQKICSRHPLHLGLDDKPLWFNSGLRINKEPVFDSSPDRSFAKFTHWVKPGYTRQQQPQWSSKKDNTFCVEMDEMVQEIPHVVNGTLHNMRAEAIRFDEKLLGVNEEEEL